MKKVIVLLSIFLSFYGQELFAQDGKYKIRYEWKYSDFGRQYHCNEYEVRVKFVGERDFTTIGSGVWRGNRNGTLRGELTNIDPRRRIEKFHFRAQRSIGKQCGRRQRRTGEVDVNHSYCRTYSYNLSGFGEAIGGASIKLFVEPILKIRFSDGTPTSRTPIACVSEGIGIQASTDFPNWNRIYRWEYVERTSQTLSQRYINAVNRANRASEDYRRCLEGDGGGILLPVAAKSTLDKSVNTNLPIGIRNNLIPTCPQGPCIFYCMMWQEAQDDVRRIIDSGEQYTPVYTWKRIPKFDGDPQINLKLTDLYAEGTEGFNSRVNKPIRIRAKPSCGTSDRESNAVLVQFLPEPPRISRNPIIEQPTCSYDSDGSFKVLFDRLLYDNEELNIRLKKLEEGKDALPNDRTPAQLAMTRPQYLNLVNSRYGISVGNNTDITNNHPRFNRTEKSYQWNGGVAEGEYVLIVSGYKLNPGTSYTNITPLCEEFFYFFKITAPDPLTYSYTHVQDETCFNESDGRLEISASGGTNPPSGTAKYKYTINKDGNFYTSGEFTSSPHQIENLPNGNYTISVTDFQNCEDRSDTQTPVVIEKAEDITHSITSENITHPSQQNASDGEIEVDEIQGGFPLEDSGLQYMNYTVHLNGDSTDPGNFGGRADVTGFIILGLPKGIHKIKYVDKNLCEKLITLPEIIDPDPITFAINKIDPSCPDGVDGKIEVITINGGYPEYTFEWYNNTTRLPQTASSITVGDGIYKVVVTDSRNVSRALENITFDNIPDPVTISNIAIEEIKCAGGTAKVTLTAEGGKDDYEYGIFAGNSTIWQSENTFNVLANAIPGYRFVARASGVNSCVSSPSEFKRINEPDEIEIIPDELVGNTIFGDNQGRITISIYGGTPRTTGDPYIVSWEKDGVSIPNEGLTLQNLRAGQYVAIVNDQHCTVRSGIIEVTEPDELLVAIAEEASILCDEGVGTLIARPEGGLGTYRYEWFKIEGAVAIKINGEEQVRLTNRSKGTYKVVVRDSYTAAEATVVFIDPEPLSINLDKIDIPCFGDATGALIFDPQGGTRPYYFSIDNRVTYVSENDLTNLTYQGLREGRYEVWLKDANGCELETPKVITVNQANEIRITRTSFENATTVGGSDGNLTVNIEGGTGILQLRWSKEGDPTFNATTNRIDNLSYGFYKASVIDEQMCLVEKVFEIKEPLPIRVEITVENPILCYNDQFGELLATVTGGFPIESTPADFEYRWFRIDEGVENALNTDFSLDKISDLGTGTYKIVVNDVKGADTFTTFELTQPDELIVSLEDTPTHVKCKGESTGAINIRVTGGPKNETTGRYLPYSFSWSKVGDPDFEAETEDLVGIEAGVYKVVVIDDNLCTTSLPRSVTILEPAEALQISNIDVVNLTGFQTGNGSISLQVSGGTRPYTYAWKNLRDPAFTASSEDISALDSGNYELTVTDSNNCTAKITREVTEPEELIITIEPLQSSQEIQCFGEKTAVPLTTTTTGGFGAYSYSWFETSQGNEVLFTTSSTPESVPAGEYIVLVVDENGNRDTDTYLVEQPETLEITETTTHLQCNGDTNGAIDITVTGGVEPYTYSWSNGSSIEDLSGLIAGKYTITVSDKNKCIVQKEIEVEQPGLLFVRGGVIERIYPSAPGFRNGRITVNIEGGTLPYVYEWFDSDGVKLATTTNVLYNIGAEKYSFTVTDANNCVLEIEDVDLFEPPVLEVNIVPINVITCFGDMRSGSISAIVQGGVPFSSSKQYIYEWFNADTNIKMGTDLYLLENIGAGNYYVKITDAISQVITSDIFELIEPGLLSVNMRSDFSSCGDENDWTIIPEISGGTPPFLYEWNTGANTNLLTEVVQGTYEVLITDSRGCTVSGNITVNAPVALSSEHSVSIPTCYEGCDAEITLTTTGGTPPYSYSWNNGSRLEDLSGVCAGTYTVSITDAKGCQITKNIVVNNPEEFIVDLGEDITLCKDQTATLDVTVLDARATYLWTSENGFSSTDPVIEVDEVGIYTIKITDAQGCTATDGILIDRTSDIVSAEFIASTQVFVRESFVMVNVSNPIPDLLEWDLPEEAEVVSVDDNYAELIFDTPGEYEITVTTFRGLCKAVQTKKVIVVDKEFDDDTTDEDDESSIINSSIEYKVYPNPSHGKFTVDVVLSKTSSINVKIFNMINNTLIDEREDNGKETYIFDYEMTRLSSGIYFILLETSSGSQVRKLVIE
ncbi:T9SS type A sorting domain-containing protein [Aquimarina sp. U1-2]|uniref:T9SS type A sorting domain-containing protein n=1 Tax=Aquimarina sp. U1-2 TaxID=2823141 RepID=UPI001AEC7A65|nr:T9SS type A sorting domain-containing protein [Aquimarina sp. U1-2]MBP2834026.1 T9SS type A sorting domain-containing protein [Aquimarina sp. U1-2]